MEYIEQLAKGLIQVSTILKIAWVVVTIVVLILLFWDDALAWLSNKTLRWKVYALGAINLILAAVISGLVMVYIPFSLMSQLSKSSIELMTDIVQELNPEFIEVGEDAKGLYVRPINPDKIVVYRYIGDYFKTPTLFLVTGLDTITTDRILREVKKFMEQNQLTQLNQIYIIGFSSRNMFGGTITDIDLELDVSPNLQINVVPLGEVFGNKKDVLFKYNQTSSDELIATFKDPQFLESQLKRLKKGYTLGIALIFAGGVITTILSLFLFWGYMKILVWLAEYMGVNLQYLQEYAWLLTLLVLFLSGLLQGQTLFIIILAPLVFMSWIKLRTAKAA